MPKLAKLLETVKLFLFETYNEISGNALSQSEGS